jgi:DNA-binding Lrp family transcriptional regulator
MGAARAGGKLSTSLRSRITALIAMPRASTPPANPPRPRRTPSLDRIDRAILHELQANGRTTYQALSDKVGLSPRPCLERVRRLEQRGVIRGYAALIDPGAVGHHVIAMAEIAMRDPSAAVRQKLERALSADPAVVELHVVNGAYDYVARVVAPTLAAYEEWTDAFLTDPAFGIARVHSTFILKTLQPFAGFPAGDSEDLS